MTSRENRHESKIANDFATYATGHPRPAGGARGRRALGAGGVGDEVSYSIGHTLVTPLPDGRVSYTPCRRCGDPCRGHSVMGRIEAQEVPAGARCRTCGGAFAVAQCDACRADGAAMADPVTIARRHLATLAELANRAVANPPHHAEEVEALEAAARALGESVADEDEP